MFPFQPLHGMSIKHFPSKDLKIAQIMPLPAALQPENHIHKRKQRTENGQPFESQEITD
jgi:hypothetical protein